MKQSKNKKIKGGAKTPPFCPDCLQKFCRYTVFTDKNYIRLSLDKIKELYDESQKTKNPLKISFAIPLNKNELFIIEGLVTKEQRH